MGLDITHVLQRSVFAFRHSSFHGHKTFILDGAADLEAFIYLLEFKGSIFIL